ncbi:hypothetical protein LMH87_001403 [Akanthomyces muscarius]|uniref:Uncharacterized protein n=1 Tax=Akanthomyces muscarius TaxID=2231603 RepID=A0A9W8UID0_AKAMU|nr:hypothetical protein LMH87_001403 [Akanthomyces muscarius]KAJ4146844.1 hypothetical protein LMH87_001403 [Akanthomyces muscarius]
MALEGTDTDRLEVIDAYTVAPWHERIQATGEEDQVEPSKSPDEAGGIIIATSSSQSGDQVGMGGVVRDTAINSVDEVVWRPRQQSGQRTIKQIERKSFRTTSQG